MISNTEPFYEPVNILKQLSGEYTAEMSEEQSAFLCGLLKKYRPNKIVEIGVAAGGTTAVMLNCIALLGLEAELFSIDLSENFYRDSDKKTGYLAEECKTILKRKFEHTVYTGRYAVEYIDDIGEDIDFLVLDTVHSMPGEILDFLAYCPHLKTGCVVVMHDISLNHFSDNTDGFATRILLNSVTAAKIVCSDINIGAFIVADDMDQNIDNVFSALMLTWKYFPRREELNLYRDCYSKYYTSENLRVFDMAIQLNQKTILRRTALKRKQFIRMYKMIDSMRGKNVYIYGCGNFGKQFYHILEECGIDLSGFIVSDNQNYEKSDKKIYYLSEVVLDSHDIIFVGVNASLWEEVCMQLQNKEIINYVLPDKCMFDYLDQKDLMNNDDAN